MNKLAIKQTFFKELNAGLPEIPNIKPFKKTPSRKVLPFSIAFTSVAAVAALAVVITLVNRPNPNAIINISPKTDSSEVKRGEDADWKTFIKAKRGPLEKQELEIAFYHGNWFASALNDNMLTTFNSEQETTLKLLRLVNYNAVTIFEHSATLYEHVCGDTFNSLANYTFVDTISADVLQKQSSEKEGNIGYMVRIEGKNGEPLEYRFDGSTGEANRILSANNSYINYSITDQGISLFPDQE